jgi:hypothetical protein
MLDAFYQPGGGTDKGKKPSQNRLCDCQSMAGPLLISPAMEFANP